MTDCRSSDAGTGGDEKPRTQGSSAGGCGASCKTDSGFERFSNLRIIDRRVRAEKWSELMQGKNYMGFDRIAACKTLSESNVVMIGVVYDRTLPKTSAKGNRYSQWHLTDLAYPQPRCATLFILNEAFESWVENPDAARLPTGSIFAVLNPVPLPDRDDFKGSQKEKRFAANVTHGTQLVHLGTSPSLGICTSKKKDGMQCSMPCDRDRGPLTCYYHIGQKEAQTIKNYQRKNNPQSDVRSDIYVCPSSVPTPATTAPRAGQSAFHGKNAVGQIASTKTGSGLDMSARSRSAPQGVNSAGASAGINMANAGDAAAMRLLAGSRAGNPSTASVNARSGRNGGIACAARPASTSDHGIRAGLNSTPGKQALGIRAEDLLAKSQSGHSLKRSTSAEQAKRETEQAFKTKHIISQIGLGGIAAPDPNNPLARARAEGAERSSQQSPTVQKTSPKSIAAVVAEAKGIAGAGKDTGIPVGRSWAKTQRAEMIGNDASSQPSPLIGSTAGKADSMNGKDVAAHSKQTPANVKKLAAQFGNKIALKITQIDPRKDSVRQRTSRFQSVVEDERAAKRHRQLSELEAQDEAAAKMEAVMSISVPAWKCSECNLTSESRTGRGLCEKKGHSVLDVMAERTRWECRNCNFSVPVLAKQLPSQCNRCNGTDWKQVSLRRTATASMEKDLFLPRGEELRFLNDIPGGKHFKRQQEQADCYSGLNDHCNQ
eukprot:TRINITY_DN30035_c0_g2_i1.p1 TRINITY_DN30035_c0_g2~~TRINITY_DN30035_c0_g2_i1.p1  ORF type:complete len:747 (-),score=76.35 TRINITY_DN30035_c0_g2_i1:116-2260(-)